MGVLESASMGLAHARLTVSRFGLHITDVSEEAPPGLLNVELSFWAAADAAEAEQHTKSWYNRIGPFLPDSISFL